MPIFVPSFSWFKQRWQNKLREDHYFDILLQSDISMFAYEGLPDGLDPRWIELYLNNARSIGLTRAPAEFVAVHPETPEYVIAADPARNGQIDQYGDGTHIAGATDNGCPVDGTLGVDAVIIYNRETRMPELDNMIDADALTQIDKSAYVNVLLSRIAPVYKCSNDNTRKALETMIDQIVQGNVKTIVSANISELLKVGENTEILDVTQPEKIQYIQYLSQYYDVVVRRHYNRRGLSVRTGTKAAQQSADEIHGLDAVSWIIPLAKLKARQDGWNEFNRVFGENVRVRFSDLWQQEYEAYQLRIMQQDAAAEEEVIEDEQTTSDDDSDARADGSDQSSDADTAGNSV